MTMTSQSLKGCPMETINRMVTRYNRSAHFYNKEQYDAIIKTEINNLTFRVIHKYSIKDCEYIITSYGNMIDAMKRVRDDGIQLDLNDESIGHRQLALPYVKDWITGKINAKLLILRAKERGETIECCICLDTIITTSLMATKCKHTFHRECIKKWHSKTCPMCRANM